MRRLHRGGHARARRSARGRRGGAAARARCAVAGRRGAQRSRVASRASSTARLAASPIACTASSRPASALRPARSRSSSALSSASPRPGVGERLEHRGGARAERAVRERLDRADAQPLVAEAAAQPERDDLVEPLGRQRGPDAQRQAAVGVQALPGGEAVLALEVVDARHAARVGRAQAAREGLVELALARAAGWRRPRPTRRSRAARRWARPRRRARPRARRRSAAARAPPTTARRCGDRAPRAAPADRRRPRRAPPGAVPDRRRASAPRASRHRSASRSRPARRSGRGAAPRRASACRERSSRASESDHSRKCTCASVKPGTTQRPSRSTRSLETRERVALAHVDAAADAIAGDRERARQREPRVAGAHAAVVQDHAAEGSSAKWHTPRVHLGQLRRPSLSSASVLPPPPPADEIARRIAAFQAGLQRDGLDAALIVQSADLVYLSGTAQNAHLVVPATGEPLLLVRRDLERARAESALPRVEPFTSLRALPAALASIGPAGAAAARPRARRAPRRVLPALLRAPARRRAGRLHARAVVGALAQERVGARAHPCSPASRRRRRMEYAPQLLVPGRPRVRRAERARASHALARPRGHDPLPRHQQRVPLRAGAGRRERRGAGPDGDAAARPGPLDCAGPGPVAARRCARATRSWSTSRGSPRATSRIRRARSSSATPIRRCSRPTRPAAASWPSAWRCCGPARPAAPLYERALEVAAEAGHAERFMGAGDGRVRFVGHCIGLELNEPPYLARGYAQPLEAGNVVAIEPKLAFTGAGRRRRREQLPRRRRRARCSSRARPRSR